MRQPRYASPPAGPPRFAEARSKRQKVRAAGLDPDYWYPVEYERAVPPGATLDVTFWNSPIVVYRGKDGRLRALENRCAHRQLKLSQGEVNGCHLTCTYHGWIYDGAGHVVHYAHDLFGRAQPEVRVRSFPVTAKHGLIWVFPGDPALAPSREIPDIPELAGPRPWTRIDMSFTWLAHHSMIIDNVSDFTHAYLHRRYRPFWDAKLTRYELQGDTVSLSYGTFIGGGRFTRMLVDRKRGDTTSIDLKFQYPYQCSDTGGIIKHWCFVLPVDAATTRVFFVFYFDAFRCPLLNVRMPRLMMKAAMRLGAALSVRPLLRQDGWAVESEQAGYEANFEAPIVELNPAVHLFQELIIRKWEGYLDRQQPAPRQQRLSSGSGSGPPARGRPLAVPAARRRLLGGRDGVEYHDPLATGDLVPYRRPDAGRSRPGRHDQALRGDPDRRGRLGSAS